MSKSNMAAKIQDGGQNYWNCHLIKDNSDIDFIFGRHIAFYWLRRPSIYILGKIQNGGQNLRWRSNYWNWLLIKDNCAIDFIFGRFTAYNILCRSCIHFLDKSQNGRQNPRWRTKWFKLAFNQGKGVISTSFLAEVLLTIYFVDPVGPLSLWGKIQNGGQNPGWRSKILNIACYQSGKYNRSNLWYIHCL